MTRNITMAFLFTLASVVLLFVIWFQENSRLPHATAAAQATKIEFGMRNYELVCANCHGLAAEGLVGPPLNNITERKGPGTEEFEADNGIKQKYGTLRNYVESTISSGVRGSLMPAWSAEFGGPLRNDQIDAITEYIMYMQGGNTTDVALQQAAEYKAALAAAQQPVAEGPTPTVPAGMDEAAARGMAVFNRGCNSCHATTTQQLVGPGLAGILEPGGPEHPYGANLPNGQPLNEESVAEWIRTGGQGQIGFMPAMGGMSLSDQDIEDLIAYLKTLTR